MMSKKWYLGLDPGKSGGCILLDDKGSIKARYIPEFIGDECDVNSFSDFFEHCKKGVEEVSGILHVAIEDVHSIYGVSASANFTFGFMVGLLRTLVKVNQLPYTMIQPKEWQKEVWVNSEIEREPDKLNKSGKKVPGKIKTKLTSLKASKRLWPTYDFRSNIDLKSRVKNPHDGLIDAALIAESVRRKNH